MISLFHIGVAVSNLEAMLSVLQSEFKFKIISQRKVNHEYIGQLVQVPGASAEIAFLDIGDSNIIELIEWGNNSSISTLNPQSTLASTGIQHICIYVENAQEWFHRLSSAVGVDVLGQSPVVVPIGPNKGCKVFFVKVLNQLNIEIFERTVGSESD